MIINTYILDIYIYLIYGKYSATLGFLKFINIYIYIYLIYIFY